MSDEEYFEKAIEQILEKIDAMSVDAAGEACGLNVYAVKLLARKIRKLEEEIDDIEERALDYPI